MLKKKESEFTSRLQELIDLVGGVPAASAICGKNPSQLYKYLSGKNEPSASALVDLANSVNISVNWLVSGFGPKHLSNGDRGPGSGLLLFGSETGHDIAFGPQFRKILNLDADCTQLHVVDNDLMAPLLKIGDVVLLDRSVNTFKTGIFLVEIQGTQALVRVSVTPKKIRFSYENTEYAGFDLDPEEISQVTCLAAVFWQGRRI